MWNTVNTWVKIINGISMDFCNIRMTTIFYQCEEILQSSCSETSLGSASAAAHFFLLSLVSLGLPGVLPVPGHGPVGGAPPPPVVVARSKQSKSILIISDCRVLVLEHLLRYFMLKHLLPGVPD